MSTSAEIGLGTTLTIDGTLIGEILTVSPSITSGEDDVSDMDSPPLWTEWLKLAKTVDVNLEMHFRPNIQKTTILTYINDQTAGGLAMTLVWKAGSASETTWSFYGLVQDCDIGVPHHNKMTNNVRIRVTGSTNFDA